MLLWAGATCLSAQSPTAAASGPVFEEDVLPIFTQYCFTCHGKSSPQLGLDLRTAKSTLRGSHNGPVVAKGSADESLLWKKVSSKAMPPAAFNQSLPEEHAATIRRWIDSGAASNEPDVVSPEVQAQIARFEKEVQPILQQNCAACHNDSNAMASLNLSSLDAVLKGSKTGPVVVEGFSDRSILVRKVAAKTMPPPGAGEPLSDEQIRTIKAWIDLGNLGDHDEGGASTLDREFTEAEAPRVTEEDREFWAFQPPKAAPTPHVKAKGRVRTAIDSFVLAELESKDLGFSPDASKQTLMRRAYFDLTGLPPTPEQARAFLEDGRPDAYERLIDQLLASPRYGERWGRYWLDAVGYVDTPGKDFAPTFVQVAEGMWRYRDYVIRSTNDDKPWDRFLTEQLAGDELVDWRNAKEYTPEIQELLTATGYLRGVLDITDDDITNLPIERYQAMFKLTEKVSSSVLGLTLSCARCHTHKFDPIPQRDYYRFLALFTAAYNPSDWVQPKDRFLYDVSKSTQEEIEKHNKEIDLPVERIQEQLEKIRKPYRDQLLQGKLLELPETIRDDTKAALEAPADKRDMVQKFLYEKFNKQLAVKPEEIAEALSDEDRGTAERLEKDIATWEGYRRKLNKLQALWDVGKAPTFRLLQRGDVESPGPKVTPGFVTVLSPEGKSDAAPSPNAVGETTGLRLGLAEWLTDRNHPLTARVIVNRVWQHHFGRGLVETPDNFGAMGAPPTHPELLDWLAVDFMENGWKLKRLHKLIMTSTAYRQSSRRSDSRFASRAKTTDPENHLLWRMNLQRLEAEAVRDSVIAATGELDDSFGGPPVELHMRPDGLQTVADEDEPNGAWRRSIYLLARRTYPLNFLGVFDYPIIDASCTRRVPSATPLQSLTLINSEFMTDSAARVAGRVNKLVGLDGSSEAKIEAAYSILFSREPSKEEADVAMEHLSRTRNIYLSANVARSEAAEKGLNSLVHMLLSSNEFLYIE